MGTYSCVAAKIISAKTSKTLKLKKEAPRSFPILEIPRSTSAADIASFVIYAGQGQGRQFWTSARRPKSKLIGIFGNMRLGVILQ